VCIEKHHIEAAIPGQMDKPLRKIDGGVERWVTCAKPPGKQNRWFIVDALPGGFGDLA
jgi:hypothetical protein